MSIIENLGQELDQEAQTTRRVLERIPEGQLGWKPHSKSMSLGQLAMHVAMVPGAIAEISQQSSFQVGDFTPPTPSSAAEVMSTFEGSMGKARAILRGMDDAALGKTWRLMQGDRELRAMPVGALLRSIMLNHWYHHRGQLSVYLRQVGAQVPSIYGPSADENPFAARKAAVATTA